jgi:hypothetical protein
MNSSKLVTLKKNKQQAQRTIASKRGSKIFRALRKQFLVSQLRRPTCGVLQNLR